VNLEEMERTVASLVAPGKGLLAADESFGTIEKRFKAINLASTEESRRDYREMLFTAPKLGQFISGAILFDETMRQKATGGATFPELLQRAGIVPGIKVDAGAKPMAGFPGEKVTEGLDGLRGRFEEYYRLGARFAKWRAVITIHGDALPTVNCVVANAYALARYAALSQEAGLAPIVEPEVLMDGAHAIDRCEAATQNVLKNVFSALNAHRVVLELMLLKPNMVIAGKECPQQSSAQEVAKATVRCLKRTVPAAVPGIFFLSGGQSEVQATENLNAINQTGSHPWQLSFSFGRGLQDSALRAWGRIPAHVVDGQKTLLRRAQANGAAQSGNYTPALETVPISLLPSPTPL
jgi:fructose-bisphosphate aldolase class I